MNTDIDTDKERDPASRCRLVLVAGLAGVTPDALERALAQTGGAGGDVASVVLTARHPDPENKAVLDDDAMLDAAEVAVGIVQAAGAAAIIAHDTRAAGRSGADGLHVEGRADAIREAVDKANGRTIVGAGNVADRHSALEIGEARPDYVFFGPLHRDIKPEPHRRNLALATWWAPLVEIPCIVAAGSDARSAVDVAQAGADFVALSSAVFLAKDNGEGAVVAAVNGWLDGEAPDLEVAD